MKSAFRTLGWAIVVALGIAASTAAKPGFGTISGVVLDPSGTPQMGASIWLISEDAGGRIISQLLSNQYGIFSTDHLKPGKYAIRVSLTGFLPAMESHIAVAADLTTMLRIQVDSVFASINTLRKKSDTPSDPDDWKWALRSSTATRAIMQFQDSDPGSSTSATNSLGSEVPPANARRGMVQLTNGSLRPGSPS